MKPILPALLVVAAAAGPAAAADRTYSVTDFDRVQVDGPYEVVLTVGGPSTAKASGSQGALDGVTVEVSGGILRIHANRSAWGGYPGQQAAAPKIVAGTRDLKAAVVRGPGSLTIDKVRGLRVDLALAGNGRLSVAQVAADQLNVALVGAGRIRLLGAAKEMKATVQGTGDLDAAGLKVDDAQLSTDTAGAVAFEARRSVKVRAMGTGDVTVTGAADCSVENAGGGKVRCGHAH